MIRVTKFHLILFCIIIVIAGIFGYQIYQKKNRQKQISLMELEKEEVRRRLEEEKSKKYDTENKENMAVQSVAVAGEYYKIAKNQGKDVSKGQQLLRRAKESLKQKDFDQAYTLAKESVTEFKSAEALSEYYTVRKGDSLWEIAKLPHIYGRGAKWVKIWRANEKKIPDFDIIYPNIELYIPRTE